MENEIWGDIKGFEGLYQVSNLGRIKRLKGYHCLSERILKIKYKKRGYAFICLSSEKKLKYYHVHRLVAETFIPNPENKPEVNHINCIKKDNVYRNLEWCTRKENNDHALKNVKIKRNPVKGINHPNTFPLMQISCENRDVLYLWASSNEASKYYGVSAIKHKRKCIGFYWKKITEKYFQENNNKYPTIPNPVIDNYRCRDLTPAHNQKRVNRLNRTPYLPHHQALCW